MNREKPKKVLIKSCVIVPCFYAEMFSAIAFIFLNQFLNNLTL